MCECVCVCVCVCVRVCVCVCVCTHMYVLYAPYYVDLETITEVIGTCSSVLLKYDVISLCSLHEVPHLEPCGGGE